MPSLRTIVSKVTSDIQRHQLSTNPNMDERHIAELIHDKRASELGRRFARAEAINAAWLSTMGVMDVIEVTEHNDPTVYQTGCTFGMVDLPEVVNLVNNPIVGDHGINKVYTNDGLNYHYFPQEHIRKMLANKDAFPEPLRVYFTVGTRVFIYPFKKNVFVNIVARNPMDTFIMERSPIKSGKLIPGDDYNEAVTYIVDSGQIEHDGVLYSTGDTFTAVEETYTGNGIIYPESRKRAFNWDDYYPMDSDLMAAVTKRILIEDYGITLQVPVDNTNDGKSGASQQERTRGIRDTGQ